MSKLNKIITPSSMLIEKTAGQMAASVYEAGRSKGMHSRYPNARAYARAYLEMYIPLAVNHLLDMLGRDDVPADQKELIYQAIQERTNDEQLSEMGKAGGLPEFEQTVLYKPDTEKPKPIIIDTRKISYGEEKI